MAAPKGNDFWNLRKDFLGEGKKISPEHILNGAQEYLQWLDDNPLIEHDFYGKDATPIEKKKMRAGNLQGLCHHLGITFTTWQDYRKNNKYSTIIKHVEQVLYSRKFDGASANILNANIIARDLGLVDKREETGTGFDFSKLKIEIVKPPEDE